MIEVNDKVRPIGYTKDDLGVGIVQEITYEGSRDNPTVAFVWWPGIKHEGAWPVEELEII